ncbi:hypothetical protein ANCDUO_01195 [Ancylostoma duodenale]|uniref:Uncharacterized protein n=1 Tax=Ancylostoma duodenale TaxID=51022 RepID=A0A0C2DET5_9BILA|nr:hypothetical protein ANCDUO_01195 [Ancylostoma duodenale]
MEVRTCPLGLVRADSQWIDEKRKMITWVGIDGQVDEDATRRFDHEILKKTITTLFENSMRVKSAPLAIPVESHEAQAQGLRESLLAHMRNGRQNLAKHFVHSFSRRDYTPEELDLDRTLRKEAEDRNTRKRKLAYIVRDFDIYVVKLRTPRDLPRRSLPSSNPAKFSLSGTAPHELKTHKRSQPTSEADFAQPGKLCGVVADEC